MDSAARRAMAAAVLRAPEGLVSRIAGRSMEPGIPDGAEVRMRPLPAAGVRTGMVVACLSTGGTLFAHRVLMRATRGGRDYAITLGDGWRLCDPPVARQDILGGVTAWRAGGEWAAVDTQPVAIGTLPAITRISLHLVRAGLALHPEIGRRTAGTLLVAGSILKTLRARLRRS
jgi:hypothetical protein